MTEQLATLPCVTCGWDLRLHEPNGDHMYVAVGNSRAYAISVLRQIAYHLLYTPLSEREARQVSDYTKGMHGAAEIVLTFADEIASETA